VKGVISPIMVLVLSEGVRFGVFGGRRRALAAEEKMSAGVRRFRVGVMSLSGVLKGPVER